MAHVFTPVASRAPCWRVSVPLYRQGLRAGAFLPLQRPSLKARIGRSDTARTMHAADTRPDEPASPAVAPSTWIRKRRRTALFATYAFALSAFWIAMIFDVAAKTSAYEHNGGLAVFVLFFLALAAASAGLGWRLARCGVWMNADGVV